jgi:ATP-dependent Lhr-like helicase
MAPSSDLLPSFHESVREWFGATFSAPTRAQLDGWRAIESGASTLLLAPTGSGKTLAAFLIALDRILFSAPPPASSRCRVLYVSPLKALALDIERNLRTPIAGILVAASRCGEPVLHQPSIAVRSGDSSPAERARMSRTPPDILITTPESLYLLLTSRARSTLADVDTVIVDEIHAMAGTKRGAHLALSLERLERLRTPGRPPLQRIGLSATQRPLEEIARLLGGGVVGTGSDARWEPRPVTIVDAGTQRPMELSIEVPVDDMSKLGEELDFSSGPASAAPSRRSIWPSIHPRLVELIRGHRSTMVFVNSRRLAERLAAAINDEAGEEIALAHHGSISRESRLAIEDRLVRGRLPAIVATSSMELGVDIGAVDLVVQIEAPPSVAAGLQRIGRSNHSVGKIPRGVVFPKFRGDLLACAATASRMKDAKVEETRYPRNPLDVLSQQIVAMASLETIDVDELYRCVRGAAPWASLPRTSFEGVLDMLAGRYPSDEFGGLRARIVWDRINGTIHARAGAQRIAIANAGTIPDRGLYGVFLVGGDEGKKFRVGELDEEMVFETRTGDVFLLGASSWRVEEITHDQVLVRPAPGEPGKMPFWHGDRPSRPLELGLGIGQLARELSDAEPDVAERRLRSEHGLDARAAANLVAYLREQRDATGTVPSDRTVVIERFLDEAGDWRVVLLTPFGSAIHAPWANAIAARIEERGVLRIETLWSDDGISIRIPETGEAPDIAAMLPSADDVDRLVTRRISSTAHFAARFRENAARALLLPRRRPGRRNPLWIQRKRASDLLAVASRYPAFPIVLETFRECSADDFDLAGLREILSRIASRRIRVVTVESDRPSPFAASLLFAYVSNFMYQGDTPLAERRAQSLTIDHAQLRELLGDREMRSLLDPDAIAEVESALQRTGAKWLARGIDGIHDLLLGLGDLSTDEISARLSPADSALELLARLAADRRVVEIRIAGETRWIAAEDAARYRDALGSALPRGLPSAFEDPVERPLLDLVSRFARTHGPITEERLAVRWAIGRALIRDTLGELERSGRIVAGAFLRDGSSIEWCESDVLRRIKSLSLAKSRLEVEPVEPELWVRFLLEWQGVTARRRGIDGVFEVIEQLEGCPIAFSELERAILPARIDGFEPQQLDGLLAGGEFLWRGLEPIGTRDARVAFYSRARYEFLAPEPGHPESDLERTLVAHLERRGASFFSSIVRELGIFPNDVLDALWSLVWRGRVTNDSLAPLRSLVRSGDGQTARGRGRRHRRDERTTRLGPPGSEGRWSLIERPSVDSSRPDATELSAAHARNLVERYGVLLRECVAMEGVAGGFGGVYPALVTLEEAGKLRRGYFIAGQGATQFAVNGAEDRLRGLRRSTDEFETLILAATDPAQPYGGALAWPRRESDSRLERRAGARVVIHDGALIAYLPSHERELWVFLPESEPRREKAMRALAEALSGFAALDQRRAFLVREIDGVPSSESPLAPYLEAAGFRRGADGHVRSIERDGRARYSDSAVAELQRSRRRRSSDGSPEPRVLDPSIEVASMDDDDEPDDFDVGDRHARG